MSSDPGTGRLTESPRSLLVGTAKGRGVVHICDRKNYGMKTSRLLLLGVLILMGVTACGTPHQEVLQQDRAECAQFGFQPGTDRYADCLLKLDVGRHAPYHAHH